MGAPALYAPLHRRLLTGYVMDALAERPRTKAPELPGEPEALHFVGLLREAGRVPSETVGLGEDGARAEEGTPIRGPRGRRRGR